jgi:hypothetical protein
VIEQRMAEEKIENLEKKDVIFDSFFLCMPLYTSLYDAITASMSVLQPYTEGSFHL